MRSRGLRAVLVSVAVLGVVPALTATSGAAGDRVVKVRDKCEPQSFDAAIGPGTCVGDGNVTFDAFIAELDKKQAHGAWRFSAKRLSTRAEEGRVVRNLGGETHTFTEVAAFGGGFVEPLNLLSGNPTPAPECARRTPDGGLAPQPPGPSNQFVPPGGTAAVAGLDEGEHRFECCLHPWMRTEVAVR
jgi:hypothetical protein